MSASKYSLKRKGQAHFLAGGGDEMLDFFWLVQPPRHISSFDLLRRRRRLRGGGWAISDKKAKDKQKQRLANQKKIL